LEVLALRVDPEFEHAPRTMKGSGNTPLARELTDIAQVDENDVAASVQRQRRFDRQGLDFPLGGFDQIADVGGDGLRHFGLRYSTWSQSAGRGQAYASR